MAVQRGRRVLFVVGQVECGPFLIEQVEQEPSLMRTKLWLSSVGDNGATSSTIGTSFSLIIRIVYFPQLRVPRRWNNFGKYRGEKDYVRAPTYSISSHFLVPEGNARLNAVVYVRTWLYCCGSLALECSIHRRSAALVKRFSKLGRKKSSKTPELCIQ